MSRRGVLKGLAAGPARSCSAASCRWQTARWQRPVLVRRFAPNVFVAIADDGVVTLTAHRSDMGQGIRTSLAQLLADELEADWARVVVVQADGDDQVWRSVHRWLAQHRQELPAGCASSAPLRG